MENNVHTDDVLRTRWRSVHVLCHDIPKQQLVNNHMTKFNSFHLTEIFVN